MSSSSEQYQDLLRAAGITPDKPLHAVLMVAMLAAETAQTTAAGARGLTPEGERELIQRISSEAVQAVDSEIDRLLWRAKFGLVLKGALLGAALLAAGYAGGRWEAAQLAPVPVPPTVTAPRR